MSKRRIKSESIENLRRVVDSDHIDVEGKMDVVMADAYAESVNNSEHVEEVTNELNNRAEGVAGSTPDNSDETTNVDNTFTAKLVLDESIEDFSLSTAADGRSRKVYEEDDEDDYLDYDMFDFIYGLVTDCWPKPLNPLGKSRIRKFMYVGSDDYLKTNDPNNRSQVATTGNSIEVYANNVEDFDDIKAICDIYGFDYEGPKTKRSGVSHWNFSFKINVPLSADGYPEMVIDYFEDRGKALEDVMPADFCKQYRKRQARIEQEANKLLNDREVAKIVDNAIRQAAQDSDPLESHLKNLYQTLDGAKLQYQKTKIKKKFLDAFNDDNVEEGLLKPFDAGKALGQVIGNALIN